MNDLKKYINENNRKRPPAHSKNKEVLSLSSFIFTQRKHYKDRTQIMTNPEIYNEWTKFMDEYEDVLLEEDDKWYILFNQLKEYINKYHKRPNKRSMNETERKLGEWIGKQISNSKNKTGILSKYENIYSDFNIFLNEFNSYL